MGVCDYVSPAINERVDIVLIGVAYIEAGAAIAAGSNVRIAGIALESASAAGDVIRVLIEFGSMQG